MSGHSYRVDTQALRPCSRFLGVRRRRGLLRTDVIEYLSSATARFATTRCATGRTPRRSIARSRRCAGHSTRSTTPMIDLGDRSRDDRASGSWPHRRGSRGDSAARDDEDGRVVVFTGDLVEESADPALDADSDVAAWPATLDRVLAAGGTDAHLRPGARQGRRRRVCPPPAGLVEPQGGLSARLGVARGGSGNQGIRVGHADPQRAQLHRPPHRFGLGRRLDGQGHQALGRAIDQPATAEVMHTPGESPLCRNFRFVIDARGCGG